MNRQVIITDCDFGDGSLERDVLTPLGFHVDLKQLMHEEALISEASDAMGLLVQYAPISRNVLDALPNLRAVVRYGVGLDTVDVPAASERGIVVQGVSNYCIDEVADHCLALMLCSLRSIPEANEEIKGGLWPRPQSLSRLCTLRGLTVGLMGFGAIARAVALRVRAFGADVVAFDPFVQSPLFEELDVRAVGIDEVLRADVISLHMPALAGGKPVLTRDVFDRMRPGIVLVNVSRGSLVDEPALMDALNNDVVSVAALDVFCHEGLPVSQLARHRKVIATPHVAYYSAEALERLRHEAASTLANLLKEAT